MNHAFTQKLGDWLNEADDSKDWEAGALMLLQLSGNRILYNNVMRRLDNSHDTINYHLRKYYNFRIKDLTHEQVAAMEKKVEKIIDNNLSLAVSADQVPKKGKRPDHDTLPDDIKALYLDNLSVLQLMRETHLKLRSLSLADAPCPDSERFPFLQEIIKLDKKLHANWKAYDSYVPTQPGQ